VTGAGVLETAVESRFRCACRLPLPCALRHQIMSLRRRALADAAAGAFRTATEELPSDKGSERIFKIKKDSNDFSLYIWG
jgi:hypothetical protein